MPVLDETILCKMATMSILIIALSNGVMHNGLMLDDPDLLQVIYSL